MIPRIIHADMREALAAMPEATIDAVVTDPPYGLSFMSKGWDHAVPGVDYWRKVFRVMKPGAWLAAFGGTRTYHRMAVAIEDAGFELRDSLCWLYASGFPKSLDVSKAFDEAAGIKRAVAAQGEAQARMIPVTPEAQEWKGWGTALKPAWEPIILARKPLAGTVIENIRAHGCGAINIAACRVPGDRGNGVWGTSNATVRRERMFNASPDMGSYRSAPKVGDDGSILRWPANVLHDGSEEVEAAFGLQRPDASGSVSRFFFCGKATAEDRAGSRHPTVKPVALMRWLVRLLTPPRGVVLDPFAGSGTTGAAAVAEARACILIERDADYVADIRARFAASAPLFTTGAANAP